MADWRNQETTCYRRLVDMLAQTSSEISRSCRLVNSLCCSEADDWPLFESYDRLVTLRFREGTCGRGLAVSGLPSGGGGRRRAAGAMSSLSPTHCPGLPDAAVYVMVFVSGRLGCSVHDASGPDSDIEMMEVDHDHDHAG
jgi:hypothetical protein